MLDAGRPPPTPSGLSGQQLLARHSNQRRCRARPSSVSAFNLTATHSLIGARRASQSLQRDEFALRASKSATTMVGRSRAKPKGTPEWDAPRVTLKASLNVAKEAAAVAKEAEAELARAKVQLEKARRRKAKAAQVFQGTNANGSIFPAAAGGSHSHTRDPAQLQLVARELTVAMMDAPEPTSSLYEFRSLVRATQRDFELALEDASQASHLQPGSASALLRQGRALAGMGRMHEAELSFLRGLDRSPHHPSLTGGFKDMLGPMQRGRFYHHRPKRRVEKVLDTLDTAKAQPPSAPRRLAVAAKREGTWLITWLPPANDGGDEIYEYEIQLSHEALSAPSGWRVEKTTRGAVHRAELDVGAYRLLPGTPVRVRVAARSPAGVGLYATVVDATDASGPPQLVASPPPEKWKSIDISEVLKGLQKEHGLDPVETFDATYTVWAAHVLPLKVSFRYCALLGSNPDPTKMAYDQFFTFMREIGALSTEVTTSLLGRLFIRSNSNRVDGDDSTARPDSLLEHDEFVAAVTRVAHHRVEGVVALDEQALPQHSHAKPLTPHRLLSRPQSPRPAPSSPRRSAGSSPATWRPSSSGCSMRTISRR